MLRLTKLAIRKFDGVEPTTLTFGPGFNVLLGKNATGKTTLLEIIAAILADRFGTIEARSREIALSCELDTAAGPMSISVDADTPRSQFHDVAMTGRLAAKSTREVRVVGDAINRSFSFTLRDGRIVDTIADHALPFAGDMIWSPRTLMTATCPNGGLPLPVTNTEGRLDEALRLWESWLEPSGTAGTLRLMAMAPLRYTLPESRVPGVVRDSFDTAVRKEAWDHLPKQVPLDTRAVPALREAADMFALHDAQVNYALRSMEPFVDGGEEGWSATYSGNLTFERHDGSVFPADWLSFGQKRMLAFLLYEASTRETPAVLDELVNGLHYEWVELCVDKLRDRQSFVTAQNPLILDLLGFESVEQVRETFVQCARVDGRMAWTNFTEAQAKAFYEAYEVGIQHVHEVLRDQGLW